MSDKDKAINVLLGLLILPFIIALRGFVLVHLWAWFILPFGTHAINIPEAAGLALILHFVGGSRSSNDEDFNALRDAALASGIAIMALGIGYVIHLFVH